MPSISGVIMWDHPRLRGEQVAARQISCIFQGSPPLARGTGAGSVYVRNLPGITPACAGNSAPIRARCTAPRDHPRLRGEQGSYVRPPNRGRGSPPLARGTARSLVAKNLGYGITPACAGNRQEQPAQERQGGDHPRLRGEQQSAITVSM